MIWFCIRGALMLSLGFGSLVFWFWVFLPGRPNSIYDNGFHTPAYWQWWSDTAITVFGGFGLLFCVAFVGAIVAYYWRTT